MGNVSSHCAHAIPLFREVGGEFITLSKQTEMEIRALDLPVSCVNDRPDLFLKFDRKISDTIKYIEQNFDIVVFYELYSFSFFSYIKKLPTVFLSHGNMLKVYMSPKRLRALKKYTHIAALSPSLKEKFISQYKINHTKLLDIGIARNDHVIKSKKRISFSKSFLESVTLDKSKIFVSYIPTWWGTSTVQNIGLEFIRNFPTDLNLLFRPHPQTPVEIVDQYRKIIDSYDNMTFVDTLSLEEQFEATSLLVGDLSSIVLEWILTDKPIIFIHQNNHNYLNDLHSIEEVVTFSSRINEESVENTASVINDALAKGISTDDWNKVKRRAFYGYKGECTKVLINNLKQLAITNKSL